MKTYTFHHKHAAGHIVEFQAGVNGYFLRDGTWTRIRPSFKYTLGVHVIHPDKSYGLVPVVRCPGFTSLPLVTLGIDPKLKVRKSKQLWTRLTGL